MNIEMDKLTDLFILFLSGAAQVYKNKELMFEDDLVGGCFETIKFPNNTPRYCILRGYYDSGVKHYEIEYKDGIMNGRYDAWLKDGRQYLWAEHKDGKRIKELMI